MNAPVMVELEGETDPLEVNIAEFTNLISFLKKDIILHILVV